MHGLKRRLNWLFSGVKFIWGYREAQAHQGLRDSACASLSKPSLCPKKEKIEFKKIGRLIGNEVPVFLGQ